MRLIVLLVFLLIPSHFYAADGDDCASNEVGYAKAAAGQVWDCWAICDTHAAADAEACSPFQVPDHTGTFWIELRSAAGCTASPLTVDVDHAGFYCADDFDTGGPPETSGSPNGLCDSDGTTLVERRKDLTTLTAGSTEAVNLSSTQGLLPHLFATINDDTGCTDLSVFLHRYSDD